ncbi:hypothetical protein MPER_03020, partial [Moniliophthora perniciosa FA553]
YRHMPTFGRDTIRRFSDNVAEMKKLAGRDFEDILQCSMPCFEGLFDLELESLMQDLFFCLSFETATRELGRLLRKYTQAVDSYDTRELPKEVAARAKRKVAAQKGGKKAVKAPTLKTKMHRNQKKFNNKTYKTHSLGHYPWAVRYWGATDVFSTQAVS